MEFPKVIYQGGDPTAEYVVVNDKAEQDSMSAKGFLPIGQTPEKRRGRPPKAKE